MSNYSNPITAREFKEMRLMLGLGVVRHKIWHDLWENKGRTLRVVAIIAIGAFAVGAIL